MMSAPTGSAPVSPFLAFVSPQDRSPMRVGLWLALGIAEKILRLRPRRRVRPMCSGPACSTAWQGSIAGPHRLLFGCRLLGVQAFAEIAAALAPWARRGSPLPAASWTFRQPGAPVGSLRRRG